MRILVTYYTPTGNTQKIAQAIHDEVGSHGHTADRKAIDASMPESFRESDLVHLGINVHAVTRPGPCLCRSI